MSNKLRLLEMVTAARRSVRDRAAAHVAAATGGFERAVARWHRATDELAAAVARSHHRLDAATGAGDLWQLDVEVGALRQLERAAQRDVDRARQEMEEAKAELAARERDVRVTERQLAIIAQEASVRQAQREQAAADDLAAVKASL